MASSRPCVGVYDVEGNQCGTCVMPSVFSAAIRPDVVKFVHVNIDKNKRQAYAVSINSGYQSSAESWGTGRAVARVPRVRGGGTHRSGQAAFANMCRGGGMFAPTKTWRRWHRKVNVTLKRHAVAAALAAAALPPLVAAKGHAIDDIPELPLVVADAAEEINKTKAALKLLKQLGCAADIDKVLSSKKIRAGVGKARSRKYRLKRGPLIIYKEDKGIVRACRNIPGVELCDVSRLNLLLLAPGGVLGRLCLFSESAFTYLQKIFCHNKHVPADTPEEGIKTDYNIIKPQLLNADLSRMSMKGN